MTHNDASVDDLFKAYQALYQQSIQDPESFWYDQGKRLSWFTPYTKAKNASFDDPLSMKWYEDGTLNACYNCVDRHLRDRSDQIAFITEGDDPREVGFLTYADLHDATARLANGLLSLGVEKGDRVLIYMPLIKEAAISMLACARIGAVHCVVFGGFSPQSIASRIEDACPKVIITSDVSCRGGKPIAFRHNVLNALSLYPTHSIEHVITYGAHDDDWTETKTTPDTMHPIMEHDYKTLVSMQSPNCPCAVMNAEDPLFILYTSGSTGKPKGLVHTTGGYLVYASLTHAYVFDIQTNCAIKNTLNDIDFDGIEDEDSPIGLKNVYWCTADVGWITGHSYGIYGPLCNGVTTLLFEGVPTYPNPRRFWQMIDRYQVSVFYTAPTVLRSLKSFDETYLKSTNRTSLRVIGTVGEPIDPVTWQWYFNDVGEGHAYVVDTWWQTETGGHMIAPMATFQTLNKPGSVALPFFGIEPVLISAETGVPIDGRGAGSLCIKQPWPGLARTIYNAPEKFKDVYFSLFKGYYVTGDGAERDQDDYFWITGRIDDILNVSGHRLGTNELETALCHHEYIAEAAVVGCPHPIKGQGIYAFVALKSPELASDALKHDIVQHVRGHIGPIASIDCVQWVKGLPKTRSGKVMRRILRKIAEGEYEALGDVSTLVDASVVEALVEDAKKLKNIHMGSF